MKFLYFNAIMLIIYYAIDFILMSTGLETGVLSEDIWYIFGNSMISMAAAGVIMFKISDYV